MDKISHRLATFYGIGTHNPEGELREQADIANDIIALLPKLDGDVLKELKEILNFFI